MSRTSHCAGRRSFYPMWAALSFVTTGSIATLSRTASIPVRIHPGATSNPILQLWVRSYTPPRRGAVEAAVSLARGDKEIEVGRFTVFPSEPFSASGAGQERAYMFDARGGLASLASMQGELTSRVRLEPIESGVTPDQAELEISRAELMHRP
jgi:hypothetical protein